MLHLQSNIQHSPLGLSIINTHNGSVSPHTTAEKKQSDLTCIVYCKMSLRLFTDVSVLHEWAPFPGISVPYLSLSAHIPTGVLFGSKRTAGTAEERFNR